METLAPEVNFIKGIVPDDEAFFSQNDIVWTLLIVFETVKLAFEPSKLRHLPETHMSSVCQAGLLTTPANVPTILAGEESVVVVPYPSSNLKYNTGWRSFSSLPLAEKKVAGEL